MKLLKIGGIASIANAFLAAFWLVLFVVLFPRLGLAGPDDWMNPVKGFHAWASSPIAFLTNDLEYILMSVATFLTILAVREWLKSESPILTQIALIATAIACGLWIATAIVGHTTRLALVNSGDASAYKAIMSVVMGLSYAGDHACGWFTLVIGWAALKTAKLPRILGYLILLVGLCFLFDFLLMLLALVGLLLLAIMSLWLGIVLMRTKM
jgi:hypothetical protein